MGYTTSHGLPIPFGFEGNNVPQDLLAFAARMDTILTARTWAEIELLSGSDVWDGRMLYQSDTGSDASGRPWQGLYMYRAATGRWECLVGFGYDLWLAALTFSTSGPTLGTGAYQWGRWSRFGTHIVGKFVVFLGSSGYVNGSGDLRIALPVAANETDAAVIGFAVLRDVSATKDWLMTPRVLSGDTSRAVFTTDDATLNTTNVQSTGLFTLDNTDLMWGVFDYEAAEG